MNYRAILLLGTNLGARERHLQRARQLLTAQVGHIIKFSRPYETEPVDIETKNQFLNQAIEIESSLTPFACLREILKIEHELGRVRSSKNMSRTIDIDILLYEGLAVYSDELIIPHPRMHSRRFALTPAAEIAPQWRHMYLKKTVQELLQELSDTHEVSIYSVS